MDEGSRKIKRFGEFMSSKRYGRSLSHLIVKGKTKSSFFRKSQYFEIHFYYTPVKKIILEIKTDGIELSDKRLLVNFKIGDDIEKVRDWCENNGHEIIFELNR
jgi:hypothetical protein